MVSTNKYDFSFTASSLRINELRLVALHQFEGTTIDYVNELGNGNSSTGKRMFAEFNKRLSFITKDELGILVNGDFTSQKQIAFLSVCKAHSFIRDFVVEVLREKLLVFDYEISEGEYISFCRRKSDFHSEMDSLTELSQSKIKQVTFKILEQAGIIDDVKSKNIQPQLMDNNLIVAIVMDDKQWLKVFLMSDMDIKNIRI
tara:strand:+ start:338 stop:940 length:603 start_codon:yes stop_codon:yes gene_type:complete